MASLCKMFSRINLAQPATLAFVKSTICTVQYTIQCRVDCTVQYTVQCVLQCILQDTIQCVVLDIGGREVSVSRKAKSASHLDPCLQQCTVKFIVQLTVQCTLQYTLHSISQCIVQCTVQCTVHCGGSRVSPILDTRISMLRAPPSRSDQTWILKRGGPENTYLLKWQN